MSGHHSHIQQFQNSTSLTDNFTPEKSSHHNDHLMILCVIHIMMALWACLANCTQILNVLLSQKLRTQPKNILVVNVCVVDLVIGAFLCPLYSESLMQGTWRLAVETCIAYEVIFYAQVCISTLSVLVLVVERFYNLLTPRMMDGSGKLCLTSLLLVIPWVTGSALVVPMFNYGATAFFNEGSNTCQIIWKQKFQAVTVFVTFFCPAFLVLTMAAVVALAYVIFSVVFKRMDLIPNQERLQMRDSLRVVLLSSLVCVLLQFPFFMVLLMEIFCQRDVITNPEPCGQSETTWATVAGITMLKPGLMPLTWLAYTDIRGGSLVENVCRWSMKRQRSRSRYLEDDNGTSCSRLIRSQRTVLSTSL